MGWTGGELRKPFTALAAIEFDLGEDFAGRVIDTARLGRVIYAAVRSRDGQDVFGLVLLTERRKELLARPTALPARQESAGCALSPGWHPHSSRPRAC